MSKLSTEKRDELEKEYKVARVEFETARKALTDALNVVSNTEKWKELTEKRLSDSYLALVAGREEN